MKINKDNRPRIGISLGDINGIGPEIILRTLCNKDLLRRVIAILYAPRDVIEYYKERLQLASLSYDCVDAFTSSAMVSQGRFIVVDNKAFDALPTPQRPTVAAARCAVDSLKGALGDMKKLDGLWTGPVSKHLFQHYIGDFQGHTEYIAKSFSPPAKPLMFMIGSSLRLALSTTHIPLKDLMKHLDAERIKGVLNRLTKSLKQDFGIASPRIAVLGINPHAGEGGTLGKEETTLLNPLLKTLNNQSADAHYAGPFSADAFFARAQYVHFDAVLAHYHDQGLIPFKLLEKDTGVNYTAGLPIPRVSPAHGTAFDIAGTGKADIKSTQKAFEILLTVLKNRNL